ncbi:MAG: 5-(carboxyamino)imidazole ribonucleotide mutase [Clostridiales bacterium]|nr:5-(carboxyamino)imidazole ribonucleotide mutase [Clostridiales bacterium]
MKKVAILMGSDSDLPIVEEAVRTLKSFDIGFEVRVISAHRTPKAAETFSKKAYENNFGVIIAAAGKAAHLAGAVAANTTLPVIGLPIKSSTLDGLDALLSTVQMPAGVPVATVAINGAKNAALLAVQILALADEKLSDKLKEFKENLEAEVLAKDKEIESKINNL